MTTLVDPTPRRLGQFEVGPLSFGCWRFTDPEVSRGRALLEAALDHGLDLVDTADVYGFDWGGAGFGDAEQLLGKVLGDAPELRDRMVLASKGGITPPVPYDSGRQYLTRACEDSLRRLGVETIDLYQVHRPDFFTHPAELAETLEALRTAGKIRAVGVSNFTVSQYDALAALAPFPIVSNQPQLSACHLDPVRDGTLDRCMRDAVVPLAWSPLAGGALATGDGLRPELLVVLDRLADRESVSRSAIALAFLLAHPSRPVAIVGTQQPQRITEATTALTVSLDRNDCYDIIEASEGVPLP